MIIYDTKKWGDTFHKVALSFAKASNYRRLLIFITISTLYSASVTIADLKYFQYKFHLDPVFFSLIGVILSLILVFRLNSAYNKWWEARTQWGMLVNNSRTLSSYLDAILDPSDTATRKHFAKLIGNFPYSLKGHLRNNICYSDFDELDDQYIENLKQSGHVSHKVATQLMAEIEQLHKAGKISEFDKLNIRPHIANLIDILGACERIKNTPIPFSHSSFMKVSLALYILILPFGLMNSFLYLTIPVAALLTFALVGIEIISEEIEEPFGTDPNDLPLTYLSGLIRKNVYGILGVELSDSHFVKDSIDHKNFKILI